MPESTLLNDVVAQIAPNGRLVRSWKLEGGISAETTAFEVESAENGSATYVLRVHGRGEYSAAPDIAPDEFRLLSYLNKAGLPVPRPIIAGAVPLPGAGSYLVMAFVDGIPNFETPPADGYMIQAADMLARFHCIDGDDPALDFLEPVTARNLDAVIESADDGGFYRSAEIRAALEAQWPLPQRNRPTVLHGDYWPGNLLWRDGRLVSIIDWEDMKRGEPLADLSISRLELLWAFGHDNMQLFSDRYVAASAVDAGDMALWDLWAAWRVAPWYRGWATSAEEEAQMTAGHRQFIDLALGKIRGAN